MISFLILRASLGQGASELSMISHIINAKGGQLTQVFDARRLDVIRALNQCDAFLHAEGMQKKGMMLPYVAFKANLLDWVIMKAEGELQERFIIYLRDFLHMLDQDTIIRLMGHRMATPAASAVPSECCRPDVEFRKFRSNHGG